jgi:RHS repeat-associated protein
METTSGVAGGVLDLPQGGGGVRGLGERFQPDLLRGSGNFSVPIPAPRGPNDLKPSLALKYSTGLGNGPVGMGWRLAGPLEIRRRTDRGVPTYDDARDEFVLSGAETLVPVGGGRYRPRSDTQFWDIRRQGAGWVVRTKCGRTCLLGTTPASRIEDPAGRVLNWLQDSETDGAGNIITYTYESDGPQKYLSAVRWSIYEIRCAYAARPDIAHDGRGGFPLDTARRLAAIERRCPTLAQPLLARHDLIYVQAEGSQLSLLSEIRLTGFDEAGATETYPPVRMQYTGFQPHKAKYLRIGADGLGPPPLTMSGTALVDMDGDGLPDLLATDDGGHRWWPNRGDGNFGPPRAIAQVPAGMVVGRAGVTFADLRGDGAADLVRIETRLSVAVENTAKGAWARPRIAAQQPAMRLSATTTRIVDLDGDGIGDLLQSSPDGYLLSYASGEGGWSRPQAVKRIADAARFPDVSLDQPGVELADMTGDGLSDIVYVASGRIEYWPYYGRGKWGARVRMRNAPVLPPRFRRERLYLTDLDGDGLTDLLYIDANRILLWLNRSGSGWSDRYEIPFVPPASSNTIELCDFLGTGTRGVLWSAADRRGGATGYRFLDIGAAGKPYLLSHIDNGLGGLTEITYATSSALRAADARAGSPWHSYLPFPVQVVTQVRFVDRLTGRATTTRTRYRQGVYDGIEREFHGFARVEVESEGDPYTPSSVQVSTFDVGDLTGPTDLLAVSAEERARRRALSGSLIAVESYELAADGRRIPIQSATMTWGARLEFAGANRFVHFPRMVRMEARDHAPGEPDRIDLAEYEHDAHGNLTRKRRTGRFDGDPAAPLVTDQRLTYTGNEAAWLVGLPVSVVTRDGAARLLSETRHFYDGPDYAGLPAGQATRGLLTRTAELTLADAALPPAYAAEIDPAWGHVHDGEGFYRTTVAYARDASGNVVGQRDGLGAQQTIAYDANALFPLRRTDSLGLVTTIDFDPRTGQPLELRLPNGTVTRYRYSPIGRLRGQFDTVTDGSVQLTQVFDVDYGVADAMAFRPSRAISLRVLTPGRNLNEFADLRDLDALRDVDIVCDYYDADGNLVQRLRRAPDTNDPARRWIVKQRRDWTVGSRPAADHPNVFAATSAFQTGLPDDPAVRFRYTGAGRLARVEQPDGGRIAMAYGTSIRSRLMPNIADADTPIIERHDAWGRLVEVREPNGAGPALATQYRLDEVDRPTMITDATGRVSARYTFAGPGPAIRIEHADAGVRTSWYDAAGRLRQRVDGLGRRLRFNYDGEGRMVSAVDASDPAHPATIRALTYDGPRLTAVRDGAVDERFAYDAAGRIVATTVDAGGHPLTLRREYGHVGELHAIVHPDGTRVSYGYDGALSLRRIDGIVEAIDYDAHGSPERIGWVGGAFSAYTHDPLMRRLLSAALNGGGALVRKIEVTYDVASRVTVWRDEFPGGALARTFGYDPANRLIQAQMHQGDAAGPLLRDDRYAYSASGDLVRNDEALTGAMLYGDAARTGLLTRVQHVGAAAPSDIVYDAVGRPTDLGTAHGLAYDAWDRLISATLPDGTVVGFAYDHSGKRVRKTVHRAGGDEITHYAEALYESGPQGTRISIYAGKLLVAVKQLPAGAAAATTVCVLTDHLGSVLAACDPAGNVLQQQVYSPYGLSLRAAGEHDAYTGVRSDTELGLTQFGVRYYVPSLGRFLTPDWWVIENPMRAMPFPQSLNAFSYAVDNPLSFRDPSGMWFGIDDLIVAGVGFAVGFIAGTIYGLATGQGWNSLLIGLEAGLVGAAGAWLAWNTAGLALGLLNISATSGIGFGIAVGAAVAGGFNGVVSGMTQIYDWTSPVGWLSFLSDSTWGLIGTTLGDLLITVNIFYGSGAKYRDDLSHRQNRHVYDGGFGFGNFAFTQGNVTSNLNGRTGDLVDHETLHITQNRIFGPIFTVTYVAWLVVGGIVGAIAGLFLLGKQSWWQSIEDVAYNDNPWESWAYDVGGSPKCGKLCWD